MCGAHEILQSEKHNVKFYRFAKSQGTYTIQNGRAKRRSNWRLLHVSKWISTQNRSLSFVTFCTCCLSKSYWKVTLSFTIRLNEKRLQDNIDHISPLQSWGPELRNFKKLPRRPIVHGDCDVVIEKPTFILKIDACKFKIIRKEKFSAMSKLQFISVILLKSFSFSSKYVSPFLWLLQFIRLITRQSLAPIRLRYRQSHFDLGKL